MNNRYFIIDKNLSIKRQKIVSKIGNEKKSNFSLEIYQEVGYYIITPLIIGVFIGLYLDRYFKTKNLLTLLFIFLGSIFTFYNLYKIYKKSIKTKNEKTPY